ncbi:MAG: hypothetical protein KDJ75_08830 [Alphaproteobacteria bacterium]|nr:hypothetical protein [Alphaproteobacteria bacterium]
MQSPQAQTLQQHIAVIQKAEAFMDSGQQQGQTALIAFENAFRAVKEAANGASETSRHDKERASAWLAVCHLKGIGCEQDVDKAIEIASPAAGWREPVAMYALAAAQIQKIIDTVPEGQWVSLEDNPAISDLERVCESLPQSDLTALKQMADSLEFSKNQNVPPAAYLQSQMYFASYWTVDPMAYQSEFHRKAMHALQDSADAGYAPAQFNMAQRLFQFNSTTPEIAESAISYAEKAYRQGYRSEESETLYNKAQGVIAASVPQAPTWSTP